MARVGRGRPLDRNQSLAALIGYKVRRHREAHGWSQEELGDRVGYTGDQISKVERGERVPADRACEVLDEVLETDEYFQEHAPHARRESVSDWMKALVDYEAECRMISTFHQFAVHGLLQTEDYARAVLSVMFQDKALDETVARRMERQADRALRLRCSVRDGLLRALNARWPTGSRPPPVRTTPAVRHARR
jgi:transcriptional regulator with XRE-family HTH domain